MAKYDLRDEAIVGLEPGEIIQALVDEAAGRSNWGHPGMRMRQRGDAAFNQVGAVLDLAISPTGHVDRRWGNLHLTARVTSVTPERSVQMDYSGALVGTVTWTFDPVDDDHTRSATRWVEDPHSLLVRLFAPLVNLPRFHARVVQEAFRSLERYAIAQRKPQQSA